jgi:hypothetical protein
MPYDRAALPADCLREKSAFERQQDALDEIAHLVEDCRNRLTFESLDVSKSYAERRLIFCLELRARQTGEQFHIVLFPRAKRYYFANVGGVYPPLVIPNRDGQPEGCGTNAATEKDTLIPLDAAEIEKGLLGGIGLRPITVAVQYKVPAAAGTECKQLSAEYGGTLHADQRIEVDRYQSGMVLVGLVDGMQGVEQLVPLLPVGLKGADQVDGVFRKGLFLFQGPQLIFKTVYGFPEGELNSSGRFSGMLDEGCEHLVKRLSDGGDYLPSKNIKPRGNTRRFQPRDLDSIRIDLGRNSMRISLEKGFNVDFELVNFGFGPFDLGSTAQKRRFRFHDIESIMAKDDDLKATKNLMGALVRMKPKQHEDMKVGKKVSPKVKKVKKSGPGKKSLRAASF